MHLGLTVRYETVGRSDEADTDVETVHDEIDETPIRVGNFSLYPPLPRAHDDIGRQHGHRELQELRQMQEKETR